jgi:hypothetical protein
MSSSAIVIDGFRDFSLITVDERLAWRSALPLHLLSYMRTSTGGLLSKNKIEEQIAPLSLAIRQCITDSMSVIEIETYMLTHTKRAGLEEYADASCR